MKNAKAMFLIGLGLAMSTAAFGDTKIHRDIVFGHTDGLGLIYDVLQPEAQNGAAIVLIRSGAFRSNWRPPEDQQSRNTDLLDAGYAVIVLYHGNAGLGREALSDLQRGIRHIRLHAANYGFDANRIGVTGHSTGGQLALLLGVKSDEGISGSDDEVERTSNEVAAVVALAPPVDFEAFMEYRRQRARESGGDVPSDEMATQAPEISPNLFVDSEDSPSLLIHGDADQSVPIVHSEWMHAELQENGIPSDFIAVPGAGHRIQAQATFDRSGHEFLNEDSDTVREALIDWFDRFLLDDSIDD